MSSRNANSCCSDIISSVRAQYNVADAGETDLVIRPIVNRNGRTQGKHLVRLEIVESRRQQVARGERSDGRELSDMIGQAERPRGLLDEDELRSSENNAPALPFPVGRLFAFLVQVV